jgi:hypothetical protein
VINGLLGKIIMLPIPLLGKLVGGFIMLYFFIVKCRIIGLLYLTNKDKLGWENFHESEEAQEKAQ